MSPASTGHDGLRRWSLDQQRLDKFNPGRRPSLHQNDGGLVSWMLEGALNCDISKATKAPNGRPFLENRPPGLSQGSTEDGSREVQSIACPFCSRNFFGSGRKYRLERHLVTHTGEKPYPCPHCPYRANVRENLGRHLRRQHPAQAEDASPLVGSALHPVYPHLLSQDDPRQPTSGVAVPLSLALRQEDARS